MHFNLGSVMLAALAGMVIVMLLVAMVAGARSKIPEPKRPTEAQQRQRAVQIARTSRDLGGKTMFVSHEDDRPHAVGTGSVRNTLHPTGYLVRQDGDRVRVAKVLENEVLTTVANTRFVIDRT